jgi:hypothetical protein
MNVQRVDQIHRNVRTLPRDLKFGISKTLERARNSWKLPPLERHTPTNLYNIAQQTDTGREFSDTSIFDFDSDSGSD